ncbi:hypothetical protein EV127DRAFT_394769 [Xylaria flabelliformis]|nr:hypothetical protein EV127DRAFT_394769 [Xylaria flabelliformis]
MASNNQEYSVDLEIVNFFGQTSATRSECDASAKQLVGGDVVPVAVQGVCSYTVYAGQNQEFVVQFRLKSLDMNLETVALARKIYGSLAPEVSFHGQLGGETDANGKEPVYIYVMTRIPGISHLDFILSRNVPQNSPEWFTWRNSLLTDMARFFALSWKHPQAVSPVYLDASRTKCERELRLLLGSLPARFHPIIEWSLDSIPAIFSLPMVLLHKDFGTCNIIVDSVSCHLVGVIDWTEAEIGPFGLNLHSIQAFTGMFHLKNGWIRYDDYSILQEIFWSVFCKEVGGLSNDIIQVIHSARIVGLLLSEGFTSRLANMPHPEPIQDNESGAYNMLHLDSLLINPATKIVDLA